MARIKERLLENNGVIYGLQGYNSKESIAALKAAIFRVSCREMETASRDLKLKTSKNRYRNTPQFKSKEEELSKSKQNFLKQLNPKVKCKKNYK